MTTSTLSNTDCLDLLRETPSESIDLIVTDPPYYIGYDGGKGWDSKWKSESEYLEWCKSWTTELVRVLKPNRMMCIFGTLKTDTFLRYKLDILNSFNEMNGQDEIIWSYNWGGRTKTNFARKHEYCWCYSKGGKFLFNGDAVRIPYRMKTNVRATASNNPLGTIPTCVWEKNNHTSSKEYVNWHPTQKPLMILERLIHAYSNPGDTVMDIFSGSGSTMISSARTGRSFIGSELDPEYVQRSLERMNVLVPPPTNIMDELFE